jgi:hypothetical protein
MDFVESIQAEGVVLERKPMGEGTQAKTPLVVEVDKENKKKDIDALDIEIPVLTPPRLPGIQEPWRAGCGRAGASTRGLSTV